MRVAGARRNVPSEIKKIIVENWRYLPKVYIYLRRRRGNPINIYSKIMKKSIFHRDYSKNLKSFQQTWKNLLICHPITQNFVRSFPILACLIENIHTILLMLMFPQSSVEILQNFERNFTDIQIAQT